MKLKKLNTTTDSDIAIEPALFRRNLSLWFGAISGRIGRIFKSRDIYIELICSLLIILFIYTGWNKLMDYEGFKFQMGRSPFLENINGFVAATLPIGELLIAASLVIKRTRLIGLYLSFFLMALFTGYIWLMLNYASDLPCSCGGILAAMSWKDHLVFNSVFTLLSMAGVLLISRNHQMGNKRNRSTNL